MATAEFQITGSNNEIADPVLCQRCQAFDIQAFSRNKLSWRGYQVRDIFKSAVSCCPFCSYLARCLEMAGYKIYVKKQPDHRWVHFRVLRAAGDTHSQNASGSAGLNITYLQVHSYTSIGIGSSSRTPLVEFHVVADPSDPASISGDVVGRYIYRNAQSQDLIDTVKSWIEICETHTICSRTLSGQAIVTPTQLPTRCLEVTADPTAASEIRIRLVETINITGNYTTLSHRWPAPPRNLHGATTFTNLEGRLAGKEALEFTLPRHFIDACILTFRLGYQYIWIDAVCIIQGKGDPMAMADWAREAPQMASYYQNSRVTIASTYGNETVGLFGAETPENSRPLIRMPYRARPSRSPAPPSFFYLVPTDCHQNEEYSKYIIESELLTRGWVVQEWILSRRILCFTPTSIYFQITEGYWSRRIRKKGTFDFELKMMNLSDKNEYTIHRIWFELVEVYSQRQLTRPETDKLMGLVGISHEFYVALSATLDSSVPQNHILVSGIWLSDIFLSLNWEITSPLPALVANPSHEDRDIERIPEVPSWSWASRMSAVKWSKMEFSFPYVNSHKQNFCELKAVRYNKARSPKIVNTTMPLGSQEAEEEWEPLHILGSGLDPRIPTDPTKTFPSLCLRTQVISVLMREPFLDPEERQVAAEWSCYESRDTEGHWRKAALASSKERICGWVALDKEQKNGVTGFDSDPRSGNCWGKKDKGSDDQYVAGNIETSEIAGDIVHELPTPNTAGTSQQQVVSRRNNNNTNNNSNVKGQDRDVQQNQTEEGSDSLGAKVQVLLVSTMPTGGIEVSLGSMFTPTPLRGFVYHVLFLRVYTDEGNPAENGFERIGVGRLFGDEVGRLFESTEPQDVWLY